MTGVRVIKEVHFPKATKTKKQVFQYDGRNG